MKKAKKEREEPSEAGHVPQLPLMAGHVPQLPLMVGHVPQLPLMVGHVLRLRSSRSNLRLQALLMTYAAQRRSRAFFAHPIPYLPRKCICTNVACCRCSLRSSRSRTKLRRG